MTTERFAVNFDYRCPFARNANEHVVAAIRDGADYEVTFAGFSLDQAHVEEGDTPVWGDPARRDALVAVAAGIVVRDRFPDSFLDAHLSLFAARHDDGEDLRDEKVVRAALERAGVDADSVFAELEAGWPFETFKDEHEQWVERYRAFGVPTFVVEESAVFVRLMNRPAGDGALARRTVGRVVELIETEPELNEFKHTTIDR